MHDLKTQNNKQPLHSLFKNHFHDKYSFDDFLTIGQAQDFSKTILIKHKKEKELYKPSKKLQSFLRFLNSYFFECLDINVNAVYSYRKEATVYQAVEKHAHSHYFFKTDIKNFFTSIDKSQIQALLKNSENHSPISDVKNYISNIVDMIIVNNHLPIGFASSPILSNALLYQLDNTLEEHTKENEIIYTRYSDDLIFSSNNPQKIAELQSQIVHIIDDCSQGKFKLNTKKTRAFSKGGKIKLLGLVILPNGKVSVDAVIKEQISTLLHLFLTNKKAFTDYVGGDYEKGLLLTSGKLNYAKSIDTDYLIKLRKKYGNFIIDFFIHQSFK